MARNILGTELIECHREKQREIRIKSMIAIKNQKMESLLRHIQFLRQPLSGVSEVSFRSNAVSCYG